MKQRVIDCEIPALSPEGKGKSTYKEKDLFVIGMYPGEKGSVLITKKRKSYVEAIPVEITTPSPRRIEAKEAHSLSCSPWQSIPYDYQIELKTQMLKDAYREYAGEELPMNPFVPSPTTEGYRTKMEYSFWFEEDRLYPAFHVRGSPFKNIILPDGCLLGSPAVNKVALAITARLQELGVAKRDLKTLTIRESKTDGSIFAMLLYTNPEAEVALKMADIPGLNGIIVAQSPYNSPAPIVEKITNQEGIDSLTEAIGDISISYPYDGFFQNNIPLFEIALQEMKSHLSYCEKLVELYSGVGTIGLALHSMATKIYGVEIVEAAVTYAKQNAATNGINNYEVTGSAAEKSDIAILDRADVVILDPPRSGLHPDMAETLLKTNPKKILYLSCNSSTQARDYALLKSGYKAVSLTGYDFYPHTLHMESLLVLERN